MEFLPINQNDMKSRGWDKLDIVLVSGDAYVDHPAWAAAIIGRFLERKGYRVGIIPQPDWRSTVDFKQLGAPRLFFGISAGNLDTMVSHYTADKKKRHEDLFSPGGRAGFRPDRASIVYTNRIKEAYPGVPVIIGGVEASLRRLAHYDYWSNQIRRSLLLDSKADLLVYGMGEYTLLAIARMLQNGMKIDEISNLRGTVYSSSSLPQNTKELPSFETIKNNTKSFAHATRQLYKNINPYSAPVLAQKHGNRWIVVNPPQLPLTTAQLDFIYEAPFLRKYHPQYEKQGGIPALKPVQFSIVTHRGCFGGCYFCSIGIHQGKFIQNRSINSLEKEARSFLSHPDFKGSIPDLGAATANMYGLAGRNQDICKKCNRISCLHPQVCSNLITDHSPSVKLWKIIRKIQGINHIRVASGVRYDLILKDSSGKYLDELCRHHVGGQLKVAPEHISLKVTELMGKPERDTYDSFVQAFKQVNAKIGKEQYLIPYFISAHPGSDLTASVELAEYIRDSLQYYPEQVQNFTPTPMTISTSMYYTAINPFNEHPVYIPNSTWERKAQRALLQYRNPSNRDIVNEALQKCNREDLINSSGALKKNCRSKSSRGRKHSYRTKEHKRH